MKRTHHSNPARGDGSFSASRPWNLTYGGIFSTAYIALSISEGCGEPPPLSKEHRKPTLSRWYYYEHGGGMEERVKYDASKEDA